MEYEMAKEPAKTKRATVAKKVHISDGKERRSAHVGEEELQFQFATGETLSITRDSVPDDMWTVAGWHGIAQKIGDTYADAKKKGLVAFDEAEAMLENIANGIWVTESQSTGPRIGLLVEAICAALAKAGKDYNESDIAAKCKGEEGTEYRKGAKANPLVKTEYDRLEDERREERRKATAKLAKATDVNTLNDL
jgi:hypothetical protein